MNKKREENEVRGVNSTAQKIGTSVIGTMTAIGLSLIVYTGVRAALYMEPVVLEDTAAVEDEQLLAVNNPADEDDIADAVEDDEELDAVSDTEEIDEDEADEDDDDDEETLADDEDADEDATDIDEDEAPATVTTSFAGITTADGLFIRSTPSVDSMIFIMLPYGTEIEVHDSEYADGWAHITFIDGAITHTGFVNADWVEPIE